MNNQEIENSIATLKKYHDLLLEIYADYSVYSKAENYSDKSLELASRANSVRNAVGTAIAHMEHQLNDGWIPVSEKLPQINEDVLVTYENGDIAIDFIQEDGNWFWEDIEQSLIVTAWQPLPEPYREVSE
jgi:hypothetical protein